MKIDTPQITICAMELDDVVVFKFLMRVLPLK
jgi:hypothetical protein